MGGTWDGNRAEFGSFTTVMAFGHATNIRVRGCIITSWYGWHAIEFNGCRDARAVGVIFTDHGADVGNDGEAVQLDIMGGAGQFPWFGPYDNTPCDNIHVRDCTFGPTLKRGIGTHFAIDNVRHTNVRIRGNHFTGLTDAAVALYNYEGVVISGNTFESSKYGVLALTDAVTTVRGIVISGNTFRNLNVDSPNDRGVWIQGGGGVGFVRSGVIKGNTFANVTRYAIAIDSTADWTVGGNAVKDCGTSATPVGGGIIIFQTTKCTVTGNTVVRSEVHL